jgi:hypothetical protein
MLPGLTAAVILMVLVFFGMFSRLLRSKIGEGFTSQLVSMDGFPCQVVQNDGTQAFGCYDNSAGGCVVTPGATASSCPSAGATTTPAADEGNSIFSYIFTAMEGRKEAPPSCEPPACDLAYFDKVQGLSDTELSVLEGKLQADPCSVNASCLQTDAADAYVQKERTVASKSLTSCAEAGGLIAAAKNAMSTGLLKRIYSSCA